MAYQFSALLVQGNLAEDPQAVFAEIGFPNGVLSGLSEFVDATNPIPGVRHLGVSNNWTMLTDGGAFVSVRSTAPGHAMWSPHVERFLKAHCPSGRAFAFIMSSVSNTYGFTLFENGEEVRSYLYTMQRVAFDQGEALDAESVLENSDKGV